MSNQPLVSIILSFRNEDEVLPELIRQLQVSLRPLPIRYELIFINDASTDNSLEILLKARETDPGIKILNMSRRWGVSECTLAGVANSSGDAVIMMDADLQDPPELLPELIAKWQQGADVVNTVRRSRLGESAVKMLITRCAYRLIRMISTVDLPVDAGDFKLLSRRAANQLIKLQQESQPYLRGLIRWIGFPQDTVIYDRRPRLAGVTHYSLLKSFNPLRTFVSGLISFSAVPLYAITFLALIMILLTVCGWIYAGIAALFSLPVYGADPSFLWPLTFGTIQTFCLGIVVLYLARIYSIVLARPNYIVASRIGFDNKDLSVK